MTKKERNLHDWKKNPSKKWPYTGDINNKKYLADRSKLFKEGGNGWWMLKGTPEYAIHLKRIKDEMP
jgi:hypothetical protein|tara:strand:+ start:24 stop:224 length:201 start_codon:yes stop_codon:yes gene_type:complete